MLKAKHNYVISQFFKFYTLWLLKKYFSKIRLFGDFHDRKLPILLISNHISWWDGFWAYYLNGKILKRKFYFMMLESQLRKFWFLNFAGGFSINKRTKSMIETLRYATDLLQDSNNLLLIFPQGKIQTMHQHTFSFEKGLEHILKDRKSMVHVLFVVNIIDYFSNRKPSVNIYYEEFDGFEYEVEVLQYHYSEFYKRCIESQKTLIL